MSRKRKPRDVEDEGPDVAWICFDCGEINPIARPACGDCGKEKEED